MYEGMYWNFVVGFCNKMAESQVCYLLSDDLQDEVCELNLPWGKWNLPSLPPNN